MSRRRLDLALAVALTALVPLQASEAQVAFERAGFRLTSIGERMTVSGRVVDARRQPVPNANIRWRVADPSIATVTPQGVVVSRKVGNTKLWAVTGDDSASALILVDQWAAKFDFFPAAVRLDAIGARVPLRIVVRDAGGHPVASQSRRPTSCRSMNERIATLAPTGTVTAITNGVTYVRCADRGVADSARIEVRQRPARAMIADKLSFGNRVVGDTFRIRVSAADASGGPIPSLQATWASLNPNIVSIDPLSGFARTVGAGTARIVAQAGDVMDTVSVLVAPGAGLAVPDNPTATEAAVAVRVPTLKIDAAYPFQGDTTIIRFVARNAAGTEVPNPAVTLESGDTSIFVVLSRHRILPKKPGQAFVLGRFGTGTVDSAQIIVRTRSSTVVTTTTEGARAAFKRPTFNIDSLRRAYDLARDSASKKIFDSTRVVGLKAPSFLVSASLMGGQTMHSFSDSTGREERSGFTYGGLAELRMFRFIKLTGEFRTGTLNSNGNNGTQLGVTEAGGSLTFQPAEVFAFGGRYTLRATREGTSALPLAVQQWAFPHAFVVVRPAFVGGAIRTVMGISALLPGATYTGYLDDQGDAVNPDPLSLGGEAGLELLKGGVTVGLTYSVEGFRFPKVGTSVRRDQFSSVTLKLGWQFAR